MLIFWQGTDVCKNSFGICTHAQVCVPGEFPEVPGSAAAQVGRVLLKMHSIRSVPGVHSWIFSWSAYVQRVILEWEEVQECCIAPPAKAQFWIVGSGGLGVFHANTGLLCKIHEIVCRPPCVQDIPNLVMSFTLAFWHRHLKLVVDMEATIIELDLFNILWCCQKDIQRLDNNKKHQMGSS